MKQSTLLLIIFLAFGCKEKKEQPRNSDYTHVRDSILKSSANTNHVKKENQ